MVKNVSVDAIHLCMFPFSIQKKAKYWIELILLANITTWDGLA